MIKNNKKSGFSLMEVLISIVIISIILVLAFPVISRKLIEGSRNMLNNKNNTAVFLYNRSNGQENGYQENYPCYVTGNLNSDGEEILTLSPQNGGCEYYEFVVPKNVHKVDMTLVAGGGGGAGASGGTIVKKYLDSKSLIKIPLENLAEAKINYLTGKAEEGKKIEDAADGIEIKGGASGHALINYVIPKGLFRIYRDNVALESISGDDDRFYEEKEKFQLPISTCSSLSFSNGNSLRRPFPPLPPSCLYNPNEKDYSISDLYFNESEGEPSEVIIVNYEKTTGASFYSTLKVNPYNDDNIISYDMRRGNVEVMSPETIKKFYPELRNINNFVKKSVLGETAKYANSDIDKFKQGQIISGGRGGQIKEILTGHGKGGNGMSYVKVGNNLEQVDYSNLPSQEGGKITYSIHFQGVPGEGGSGGTAIRLNDFPVVPGERYIIAVGKGGKGGAKGKTGTITTSVSLGDTKRGEDGLGGYSSAIYRENGTMVALVAGGFGGLTYWRDGIQESPQTDYQEIYQSSASSLPIVASDEMENVIRHLDSQLINNINTNVDNNSADLSLAEAIRGNARIITYQNNEDSPIQILHYKDENDLINPILINGERNLPAGIELGRSMFGFSSYNALGVGENLMPIQCPRADGQYFGVNNPTVCTGFYYRNLINNEYHYVGGLGGHSGIGTKAGCGGYFLGNNEGYTKYTETSANWNKSSKRTQYEQDPLFKNTFYALGRVYKVDSFYDGCSAKTPDGHAAEFVAPQITKGGVSYGAAGSGGGGGGYSLEQGPGKGGDGQNGYVFINWKTE